MINRRNLLKAAAASVAAGAAPAQETAAPASGVGPYDHPTATFDKAKQDRLPPWAFREPLARPLVPRPVAVLPYGDPVKEGARPFGDADPVPIGEVYHGVAREWAETPEHWADLGCDPGLTGAEAWDDKRKAFGQVPAHDGGKPIDNWGGLPVKCYKIPIVETQVRLGPNAFKARAYGYAGMVPGPMLKLRLGQPVVVRYQNHLETEVSVHLHGAHSPSHSDGFPSFYVLQGKSRDYFYPNILPLGVPGKLARELKLVPNAKGLVPDVAESQSTMWYHDHGMDGTGYNVSKGLAGLAPCFGERELKLIRDKVLPGLGPESCVDPERDGLRPGDDLEHPDHPGFYHPDHEPYRNPYDIPIVLQDKVIDPDTGQIAFSTDAHNGYLGDTFLLNGVAYPYLNVCNRKYRFRFLDGSNARVFRLRILSEAEFARLRGGGGGGAGADDAEGDAAPAGPAKTYDDVAETFLRIGKDSWLWNTAEARKSLLIAMANRADIVVDFKKLAPHLKPGEEAVFYLVNTMPQANGRGPKQALDDGGDPRVLPLPFDTAATPDGLIPTTTVAELARPIGLMKIVVQGPPIPACDDATVEHGTTLNVHEPIEDGEIQAVREFIFERGKGAWKINGRFYDPTIANATPTIGSAEEWVLKNGGGGWWHPIHIHLESHQLVSYEKDFAADAVVDVQDPPAAPTLNKLVQVIGQMEPNEQFGLHDTQILGPNTVARIRMRFRTWNGPFVFHCHNLEHEDMRMMHNFEPVPRPHDSDALLEESRRLANAAPDARTHGRDVTYQPPDSPDIKVGELPWEYAPVPATPVRDAGSDQIPRRRREGPG